MALTGLYPEEAQKDKILNFEIDTSTGNGTGIVLQEGLNIKKDQDKNKEGAWYYAEASLDKNDPDSIKIEIEAKRTDLKLETPIAFYDNTIIQKSAPNSYSILV